jgi:hypothetical protein
MAALLLITQDPGGRTLRIINDLRYISSDMSET